MIVKKDKAHRTEGYKGFTLVELLVVISILGILLAFITSSFRQAQKQARDVHRKSDMNQYRTALENNSIKTGGTYPKGGLTGIWAASDQPCLDLITNGIIVQCMVDEDANQSGQDLWYRYCSNAEGTDYAIAARLETTGKLFYLCSNGKSGERVGGEALSLTDCN